MAVYTPIIQVELDDFLSQYDIGNVLTLQPISEGVENTNYCFRTASGAYILTLFEKRVKPAELPFFLSLMQHLAAKQIPCPQPLAMRDGNLLAQLKSKPAAITTFLEGAWPRSIDLDQCRQVGECLAKLHLAAMNFTLRRDNDLSLAGWKSLYEKIMLSQKAEAQWIGIIAQEILFLEQHWPLSLPSGIIHADLFPDNVFFKDGRITGILDFYFACHDFLAYDLAITVNAWCFEGDTLSAEKKDALVSAYESLRPLTVEEWKAWPILLRGAALRFFLSRLHDLVYHDHQALVTPKDPAEYLGKLQFHQVS